MDDDSPRDSTMVLPPELEKRRREVGEREREGGMREFIAVGRANGCSIGIFEDEGRGGER